ncbi:ligand-binding sensor domain-containing protein [Mesomycoplasma molare]|uniref:Septation ring formation regulator n=1 Tax=Mesomycoplasma molare TaxID=171288 RepID=A0ABY5TU60_9BACT|nr:hypothetical protein [Mesomycoplasma molare]UWD34203.1 hypothetical protein NX772_03925 [Mesomycoplasma molare]
MKYFLSFLLGILIISLFLIISILLIFFKKKQRIKISNKINDLIKNEKNLAIKNKLNIIKKQLYNYFNKENIASDQKQEDILILKNNLNKIKKIDELENDLINNKLKKNRKISEKELVFLSKELDYFYTEREKIYQSIFSKYKHILENNKFILNSLSSITKDLYKAINFYHKYKDKLGFIFAKAEKIIEEIKQSNNYILKNYHLDSEIERNTQLLEKNKKNIISLFQLLNNSIILKMEIEKELNLKFTKLKAMILDDNSLMLKVIFSLKDLEKQIYDYFSQLSQSYKDLNFDNVKNNLIKIYKIFFNIEYIIEKEKAAKIFFETYILSFEKTINNWEKKIEFYFFKDSEFIKQINFLKRSLLALKIQDKPFSKKIIDLNNFYLNLQNFKNSVALKEIQIIQERTLLLQINRLDLIQEILTDFVVRLNELEDDFIIEKSKGLKKEILKVILILEEKNIQNNEKKEILIKLIELFVENKKLLLNILSKELLLYIEKNMNIFRTSNQKLDAALKISEDLKSQGDYYGSFISIMSFLEKEIK